MKRIFGLIFVVLSLGASAQKKANYDESKVPLYILPEVLKCNDGMKVTTRKEWEQKRRPEILEYFFSQLYGRTRHDPVKAEYRILSEEKDALDGKATIRQIGFTFSGAGNTLEAIAMTVVPNHRKGRVPVFVAYNFKGNHSTLLDSTILYSPGFRLVKKPDHPDWRRGCQMNRWPFEKILERGYAVITMCYHDIYPDARGPQMLEKSACALFPDYIANDSRSDAWRAIGAWAWGSSRLVDYLQTQDWADRNRIAIMGHSRQGKAALWAGAQDPRFKVVISNCSGSSGAALSKRVYGESLKAITRSFPWWFCPIYTFYANNEEALPFDQHELIALMAPRHVYVASALNDRWADPKGEFLAASHAEDVYRLYNMKGLGTSVMPDVHKPIQNDVGYHIRKGKHDVTDYDWECFMDFCDKHFRRSKR